MKNMKKTYEVHTKNRMEADKRKKDKYIEDRLDMVEKALESHAKILARFSNDRGGLITVDTYNG